LHARILGQARAADHRQPSARARRETCGTWRTRKPRICGRRVRSRSRHPYPHSDRETHEPPRDRSRFDFDFAWPGAHRRRPGAAGDAADLAASRSAARVPILLGHRATDGAFILTFQHFSTWELGYNFFFLDIESQPPWHFYDERFGLYFEYAPTLSLNKLGLTALTSDDIINDLSLTLQLDLGYAVGGFEINRVFLEGVVLNWSVPGAPVFETHFLARQEHHYGVTWQFTFAWLVPLSFGEFRGFLDIWQTRQDDAEAGTEDKLVVLSQPQLLLNLGKHFQAGAELELRHDFPGKFAYANKTSTWDFRVGPMLLFNF